MELDVKTRALHTVLITNVSLRMGLVSASKEITVNVVKTGAWIVAETAPIQPSVQRARLVDTVTIAETPVIARGVHVI